MTIFVKKIEYQSPEHDQMFKLRNKELYRPWNLDLDFEVYYSDLGCELYGLYNKDSLIGSVQTRKNSDGSVIIKDLVIHFKYRNQGLGTSLLKFAEASIGEDGFETILVDSYRSSLPFFLKNGYKQKEKRNALNKMLVFNLVKSYKDREKLLTLPFYNSEQNKPVGLILHATESYDFLPHLRQLLPKENVILIELPNLSKDWLDFANRLCIDTFKIAILSPKVEASNYNFTGNILRISEVVAQKTKQISEAKSSLLIACSQILESKNYEDAFNQLDQSLSLIQLPLNVGSIKKDLHLESNFYSDILQKLEDLQKETFDTLVFPDFNLIDLSIEIKDYIEINLERKLKLIDLKSEFLSSLRNKLIKENLASLDSEMGYLKIYSQYPSQSKNKLIASHPSERSTHIEKILSK